MCFTCSLDLRGSVEMDDEVEGWNLVYLKYIQEHLTTPRYI